MLCDFKNDKIIDKNTKQEFGHALSKAIMKLNDKNLKV